MTKIQKKNREFLEKLMGRDEYIITAGDETDCNKLKNRAGWAFLVLTIIVTSYFFVWAWTNFERYENIKNNFKSHSYFFTYRLCLIY